MGEIELSNGGVVLVDDDDMEWLSKWTWRKHTDGSAVRMVYYGNKHKTRVHRIYRMHRVIMDAPRSLEVDHIDGNQLNNMRSNLRLCTSSENKMNTKTRSDNASGIKGVCWDNDHGAWMSYIKRDGKMITLGRFRNKQHARIARRAAEKVLHGEFRRKD